MSASYPIRPVDSSELPAFGRIGLQAFNSSWPADELLEIDRLVVEPERTLAAFDGERQVGTLLAYSFGLTVPGGTVPAAGISSAAVLPSHRRRGILSALVRRQLADIAEAGEPVAALFASEASIYGRFGYGQACDHYRFTVHRGDGRLRPLPYPAEEAAGPLSVRLAEPKAAVAEMKAAYEVARPQRPGMLTRHDGWWGLYLSDPEFMRDGRSPLGCVIAEDPSKARGYALYSVRGSWDADGIPEHDLAVHELIGTDPGAVAALWTDLLSRDLVGKVTARMRPVDDPLPYLLADQRRARARVSDGLWIRLVDVPEALRRRRYAASVDVVIEVSDSLLPANDGRWLLRSGGLADNGPGGNGPGDNGLGDKEPTCERTTASADIALPVAALGAAYLGGTRLGTLARQASSPSSGRVRSPSCPPPCCGTPPPGPP